VSSIEALEANVAALRDDVTELKADSKSLREKVDKNFERLCSKIDTTNQDIKETNRALVELTKTVIKIDSRLAAILWMGGGLIGLAIAAVTLGKAFHWLDVCRLTSSTRYQVGPGCSICTMPDARRAKSSRVSARLIPKAARAPSAAATMES